MSAIDEMYERYGFGKRPMITDGIYPKIYLSYPPFTAKKQLELIKLIIELDGYSLSIYKDEGKYVFELFDDNCTYSVVNSECDDYTDSLALLVTQLTEYLDNQKVKEILER